MIVHEPRGRTFEGIAEVCGELVRSPSDDLDVLFVSEESSWLGSRRLARELKGLQESLQKTSTNCLVRRV